MRLAYEWIREYAPTRRAPEEVARRLTAAGLSVERIEREGGEHLFEIDVTTNRPDCMNLYGICRETAALTGVRLRPLRPRVPGTGRRTGDLVSVEIRDPDLCPRYSARVITGLRVVPSPGWIQKRLTAMGVRPINLVVDVTNYVLMEMGQPLHAFDLDRIEGHRIVVRRARRGESIRTLDGIERKLRPEMLVIADARRPVAIAGVMGGSETEIGATSRRVLLESAHFDPRSVRRTARAFGLHTEASHRFERGADIEVTRLALDRCCELLLAAGRGEVARGFVDCYPRRHRAVRLRVSTRRATALIGDPVTVPEAGRALRGLGFTVRPAGDARLAVTVPSFRRDIEAEVDLIEEIARSRGYDRIPARLPVLPGGDRGRHPAARRTRAVKQVLVALGAQEVINLSMVAPELEERFGGPAGDRLSLDNPLSDRASVLRRTLLPGLLQNLAFNRNRGIEDQRLFEIGRVFHASGRRRGRPPRETTRLAIATCGTAAPIHWSRPGAATGLYDCKGWVETVIGRLGGTAAFRPGRTPWLAAGEQAEVYLNGTAIGWLGRLDSDHAGAIGLDAEPPVYLIEITLDPILQADTTPVRCRPVPKHPAIFRDLALVVDAGRPFDEMERVIRSVQRDRIATVEIFDRFTSPNLPPGKLSLGVRIEYQRPDRTLLKEEVASIEERILSELHRRLGITRRGPDASESNGRGMRATDPAGPGRTNDGPEL